jgi:diguanylate cyclase (GGDEF)-like protein
MRQSVDLTSAKSQAPEFTSAVPARRDLLILLLFVIGAIAFVFLFDTGSIAEWVANHKDSKVDEVIVASFALTIGLAVFSLRRSLDLKQQMHKYQSLYTEMKTLTRETTLLGELSELLQSCLSPAEAHRLIAQESEMLFPGSSGVVCVTASSRDVVECVAQWGEPALVERFFPPSDCWALRRGRLHQLSHDNPALICGHVGAARPRHAVCVPMMAHGETLGVLYLESGKSGQANQAADFSESQLRAARMFAEHIALALANLNLREVLRSQSIRDPLTGLFNRRYMEESLERELRRAVRRQGSVGVMMIDVDHFKSFNDSFGHDAGDALLRELAKVFKTQFRGEDIVCRYGGEEFTVILPDASLESTQERAQRLREVAKATVTEHRGRPLDRVTLSIGVAAHPEKGSTVEGLLRAADSALYRAKEEGRDQVVMA